MHILYSKLLFPFWEECCCGAMLQRYVRNKDFSILHKILNNIFLCHYTYIIILKDGMGPPPMGESGRPQNKRAGSQSYNANAAAPDFNNPGGSRQVS